MSGNHLEKQTFIEKQELTTTGEQIIHEEILNDLQANETDLIITTTEKNTGKLHIDVLNNPIKIVQQKMSDPTESLPAGITLGEMKDASGTVTFLAFIDAAGNTQANSTVDVEQLNNEIAASGSPLVKEFFLGGQVYRCSYTISGETLSVSIDLVDAFEQLPVKMNAGPMIPNAKGFETARPNTQEYWLVQNGTMAYPRALYQRITKTNQVGKRVPQQAVDMSTLGVTKAELATGTPVEKIGTVTLPDTGEIRRYKAVYTVVDGKLAVTLTEASIELQPSDITLQHIPQISNGIDETKLAISIDQGQQLLTIDYAGQVTPIDLTKYSEWKTYGTTTTLHPTDLPKIPMADGRILRLGITLERKADGSLQIWTRETPVAHETIQFADSAGNPQQTPLGKTLRRLNTDGAALYREITDTSRYGGVLARLPVASEDFDHRPGTMRSLHTSPIFINGKTYEPVLGVDAGGTHLLQLRTIEGARGLIKGVNPFVQYGGGEPQAGAREIQAISSGPISKWTPDDPKNRAALDTFFMTHDRTITVQYRSPDGTLVPITLDYGFEDVYNKGVLGKNSIFRQKTVTIDGKQLDLQFRLAIQGGYLQMTVDNVTKREDIKLPEILQDPKDAYTNFLREELVYGNTTVKGYFNQLNGPASLTTDRETKFKKLYPSQQNVAGIPFDNSTITIFRTDEFKPLNVENPLELGDDDSLFSFDLDTIPADKRNRMKPVINPDGSRNGGEKHTFYPKVADRGTLGFRPPLYNNETRPTEVTLEPIWGTPEIVEDDKGDFDPRNDVKVAKRPLLGYATRIKVLIPESSKYREADREIDRDYIQQKAKEMGITALEVIEKMWGVGAAFLSPVREKIKEKARSIINMIPDPEVGKKQKFVDIAELQKLDMAWPLPGYKYKLQASAQHENIPEFMGSTDFGWRYVNEHSDRIDFHPALDIGGLGGNHPPVVAALEGKVKYGNSSISVLHDEQVVVGGKKYNVQTNYIHVDMSRSMVADGAKVTKGQQITTVVDDHLHFEVALIDPSTGKEAVFTYPPPQKIPSKYASLPLDTKDNPTNCINPAWFFDPGESGAEHDFYGKLPQGFEVHQTSPSETAEKIQENTDIFVQEMAEWAKKKGGNHAKAYEILQKMHFHGEDLAITGIESNYGHPSRLKNPTSNARGPFQVLAGTSQNGFHTDLVANGGTRPYNTELLSKYVEGPPYTRLQDKEDPLYTNLDTGTMIGMSVVYTKIYDLLQTKSDEINGKKFDSYRGSLQSRKEDVKKRLLTVGIKTFDDKIFDDLAEQIRTEEEYYTRWKVRCKYGAEEMTGYTEPFRATHALTVMYLAKIQNSLPPQDNGGGGSGGSASGETTKTEEEKRLEEELNKNKKKKTPENIDPSALVGLSMEEYTQGLKTKETQGFGNGVALAIGGKNVYYYDPKVAKGTRVQGGTKVLYKNTNNKDTTGFYLLQKDSPYVTFMFKAHEMTTPTEITVDNKKISRKITTEDITDTNGNITAANQPVVTFMTGK